MKTTPDVNEILEQSRLRGVIRGTFDVSDGIYNPSPLSGEWAGESINELLGDLIDKCDDLSLGDVCDFVQWLCDEYEDGYISVFDANDHARSIRDAVIEEMI